MSRSDALARLLERLDACGIPRMVVGSFASTALGEYRTSADLDIVIDPTLQQLKRLLEALQPEYYVDVGTALQALESHGMFNVIDLKLGWKTDLIVRKDRPYSELEFRRRLRIEHEGLSVEISSAEDTILSKLEWNKLSGSLLQRRDAVSVAVAQWKSLDLPYLRRWALSLGIVESVDEVLEQARLIVEP